MFMCVGLAAVVLEESTSACVALSDTCITLRLVVTPRAKSTQGQQPQPQNEERHDHPLLPIKLTGKSRNGFDDSRQVIHNGRLNTQPGRMNTIH